MEIIRLIHILLVNLHLQLKPPVNVCGSVVFLNTAVSTKVVDISTQTYATRPKGVMGNIDKLFICYTKKCLC